MITAGDRAGVIIHLRLMFQLRHADDRLFHRLADGCYAMTEELHGARRTEALRHLLAIGFRGDEGGTRIDWERLADHAYAGDAHRHDRNAEHRQHDAEGWMGMNDGIDLRSGAQDASVDHHLVALQDARRSVDQIATEVAHHHVLGPHP